MMRFNAVLAVMVGCFFASYGWAQCSGRWLPGDPAFQPNGPVTALAEAPNGDLIAAGTFTEIGGVPANRVARWNGQQWTALGSGVSTIRPYALLTFPDGRIWMSGEGMSAGQNIGMYEWNGTTWRALLSGAWGPIAMLRTPDGRVFVGGGSIDSFGRYGLVLQYQDGQFRALPETFGGIAQEDAILTGLAVLPDGRIVASGFYGPYLGLCHPPATYVNGNSLGIWDGSCWSEVPVYFGSPDTVMGTRDGLLIEGRYHWRPLSNDQLFSLPNSFSVTSSVLISSNRHIVGAFSSGQPLLLWNGSSWVRLGTGLGRVPNTLYDISQSRLLYMSNRTLVVADPAIQTAGGFNSRFLARYVFDNWCPPDFDCSGLLNSLDLFAFLNGWFAGDVAADIDSSGLTDSLDILAYIDAWFAGC